MGGNMKKKFFVFLFLTSLVLSIVVSEIYCELFFRLNCAIERCNYENEEIFEEMYEEPEQIEFEQALEKEEQKLVSLGDFRLTAYCSCEKCCGKWALNRPKDENGKDIVYGSTGSILAAGASIAVDPSVIPYGSQVEINGHTYTAHDTGGAIQGNRIDVYFDNHQDALNFGVQYAEVFLIVGSEKNE